MPYITILFKENIYLLAHFLIKNLNKHIKTIKKNDENPIKYKKN